MEKEFFWRDKSGRGFTNTFDEESLVNAFDSEGDRNGETIPEWLETAEVGDRWENDTSEVTRTK